MISNSLIHKRTYLKGAGVTLGTLAAGTIPVLGADEEHHLEDTGGTAAIYWSDVDQTPSSPDAPGDFLEEYPEKPFFGASTKKEEGFFDATAVRVTPNHQTLKHSLRFMAGVLMDNKPKPYTLVNQGDGLFESRGQTMNFTARPQEDLEGTLIDPETEEDLAKKPPLSILAGERWRAVTRELLKVDLDGDEPYDWEWAVTRADFYTRGGGPPTYTVTLLYVLWAEAPDMSEVAQTKAVEFINAGRANLGGQ